MPIYYKLTPAETSRTMIHQKGKTSWTRYDRTVSKAIIRLWNIISQAVRITEKSHTVTYLVILIKKKNWLKSSNLELETSSNCFNCNQSMACSLTLNKLVSCSSRDILRQAFSNCDVKNISGNFKRFRPVNSKGMPIGLYTAAIFPIFFAQTARCASRKNYHYFTSTRLILVYANPAFL